VLTAHLDLPVVAETTVQANLLHAERGKGCEDRRGD
jgi:hypothetical protein